jgi:hypothetical protein
MNLTQRPQYPMHADLPTAIAEKMVESSRSKWVWVDTDGVAWWVNTQAKAENSQRAHGGVVFAPEA